MIAERKIEETVNRLLENTPHFLTEVEIAPTGKVVVFIDSFEKFTIEDCVTVNRAIRKELGEALDDFDLTVSSAGMDRPFKTMKQYHKNLDREISVLTTDGKKTEGILKRVTDEGLELLEMPKPAKKGMPAKKGAQAKLHEINFANIKEAKRVITF